MNLNITRAIFPLIASAALIGCASGGSGTSPLPPPEVEGALNGYELVGLMSGASTSGNSLTTEGATWSQQYPEIPLTKTRGKGQGIWNPPGGPTDTYDFSFQVKGNQWCEDWGSGRGCWHIVRVDDNTIQAYRNGQSIGESWTFRKGQSRPVQMTGSQLAEQNSQPTVTSGSYQDRDWERHRCNDGTEHFRWQDTDWVTRSWSIEGDHACWSDSEGKRCSRIFVDAIEPNVMHYVRVNDSKIRGQAMRHPDRPADRCNS